MSRIAHKRGVNIPVSQDYSYIPSKSETVIIPSSTTPLFGSMFNIDVRETNCIVEKLTLQFNLSALSGMTNGGFVPAQFFVDHIDVVCGGNIIDTYTPLNQFINAQLFETDETRAILNTASGDYSSTSKRITLAASASSYYLPLYDFFKQSKAIALLENTHNFQLRLFLRPLLDVVIGSGTPSATINSCNLLMKVMRLNDEQTSVLKTELGLKKTVHAKFHDLHPQSYAVNSGVVSTNIVLSAITGPISHLMFVVRTGLGGDNAFAFSAISSFEILNSSGQNIVGGQPITHSQSLLINGAEWSASSYLSSSGANVYMYCFCSDIINGTHNAVSSGSYNFSGSEQLKLNFGSALGSAVQVDVISYSESVLHQTRTSFNKTLFYA